jgi:hypothetical protein
VDHYEALGVPRSAAPAEIRQAYLRLARRHHPDRQVGAGADAERAARTRMAELNQAWEVLGDPARRRRYDEQVPGPGPGPEPAPPGVGWRPRADDTGWMSDFEAWRNETDELSDEPFPGARRRPSPLMVLPVGLFAVAVAVGCVGVALQARSLLAVAFGGVGVAALLFFVLPVLVMVRSRGR